ncbi:hypothetical protein UGMREWDR_CDS0051 [Aeromonas phage GomatiRiver_11]|nr:hypothetical protein UGMREWDR_CDS0051 [Aeromonas phage GomatiRiver_11]
MFLGVPRKTKPLYNTYIKCKQALTPENKRSKL